MRFFRGQSATEYLVLLAVVLVIALVGVALLGFFPGTASEAQARESEIYWRSATPIAITEWMARAYIGDVSSARPYLRIRNTGQYPIRITGLIGADGGKTTGFWGPAGSCFPAAATYNLSDYFYLAPGEENYFSWGAYGTPCEHLIWFKTGATASASVGGATSVCQNSTSDGGFLEMKNFGFEYVQYVEGQQITKRQIGAKPIMIKCLPRTP